METATDLTTPEGAQNDPEPLDKRTKAHREWVKRQTYPPNDREAPPAATEHLPVPIAKRPLEPEGTIAGDFQGLSPVVSEPAPPSDGTFPEPPPALENHQAPPIETPLAETLPEVPPPPAPPSVTTAAPTAELRYFKKISVNLPLYVDKVRIQFEVLSQNTGVIRLDPATDARAIEVLDGFAKARVGGVGSISAEDYADLKKNLLLKLSAPRSQQPKLRVWDNRPKLFSRERNAGVAEAANSPAAGSRGSAPAVVGDVAGAKSPATFTPNLQRKSGMSKIPASGKFRPEAFLQPPPIG